MIDPQHAALVLIDMQEGFIDAASPLCIAGAAATVPACARALESARAHGMTVVHVRRQYAADGSNVEAVRWEAWAEGGRPLSTVWPESLGCPKELAPLPGEPVIFKPSFSAFFGTELAALLRQKGITTIVLAGTTTPNCVRSTAYDGLSLGFTVAVVRDATSSRTPEVQEANLADMAFIGVSLIHSDELAADGLEYVRDTEGEVARAVALERKTAGKEAEAASIPSEPVPHLDSIETVSTGWINKYLLHYTTVNGKPYTYEAASRKGPDAFAAQLAHLGAGEQPRTDAVGMVPILPDGSVLLIREFRYPLNSWCISFPAGLIDGDESLREAVARELAEETGYRLREELGEDAVRVLPQTGFSSTGMSEESVQVVYAFVEPAGEARPEDAELIRPFVLKRSEIRPFLEANRTPIGTRAQLILEALAL